MHLIIATRGNKESVDLLIKELSSKYLSLPFRDKKTGEIVNVQNPVHVRPMQVWDIVFPKEYKDIILTTLFKKDKNIGVDNPMAKRLYKWVLKFLPFQKVPEDWDTSKFLTVENQDIEIVGLGMKEDKTEDFLRSDEQMKSIGLDPTKKWEYEGL